MLYTRPDGSISMERRNCSSKASSALLELEGAIKAVDKHYEHMDAGQHRMLRAMAGHLMAMIESEE